MFKVPRILTQGPMTSGNPAPASCPAWLSAWLLPSPVSWHSPSGTQNREFEEERASSAKAQLWEKKDQSTSQAWKKGREEGQGNWDRFKHILRRLIRPGSYLRNEVLNQQLIHKFCLSKAEVLADPIVQSVSVVPGTWITSTAATCHPSASSGIPCTHP